MVRNISLRSPCKRSPAGFNSATHGNTYMPQFSLIIPTVGRTEELEKLLGSLANQRPVDFEIVIVDQNEDERVEPLLSVLTPDIAVSHLRLKEKNVSLARNLGLSRASGEINAFPDDDCWYPSGLLPQVENWFRDNPKYDILAVGANDEQGLPSGNRWIQSRCDIRPLNALRTTFCNSLFLRRKSLPESIRFDESVTAGEETDYILKLMKAGLRGRFDRTWHVCHPRRDMLSGTVSQGRAIRYGQGMGRLVRRHSLWLLWVTLLGYDLLRALVVFLSGRFSSANFCLAHAWGLFRGFVYNEPQ
jgi:glycosyltransferase involved in cell wall biosynthesis